MGNYRKLKGIPSAYLIIKIDLFNDRILDNGCKNYIFGNICTYEIENNSNLRFVCSYL